MIIFRQTFDGFLYAFISGRNAAWSSVTKSGPHSKGRLLEDRMNVMIPSSKSQLMQSNATFLQNICVRDQALASFVAELFSILHPATLPMLERMFEDVGQDAENDGELELKWRAEIGVAAAKLALKQQEAL